MQAERHIVSSSDSVAAKIGAEELKQPALQQAAQSLNTNIPSLDSSADLQSATFSERARQIGLSDTAYILAQAIGRPNGGAFSLQEIREIGTLSELQTLYAQQGLTFKNNTELFTQVGKDWRTLFSAFVDQAKDSLLPESLPILEIACGEQTLKILGVAHTHAVGARYFRNLLKAVSASPFWVNEHNLGREFLPGMPSVEISDHYAEGVLLCAVKVLIKSFSPSMMVGIFKTIKASENLIDSLSKEASVSTAESAPQNVFEIMTNLPYDGVCPLPSNIALIKNMQPGEEFNSCQKRSAYQAGFFKEWNPQQIHQVSEAAKAQSGFHESTWSEKNILVGAAHAHEIEFILKRLPSGLKSYFDRGVSDAQVYNADPQRYFVAQQKKEIYAQLVNFGGALGVGVSAVGLCKIIAGVLF